MLFYLIFFFTVLPLVELFFLIRAGQIIGLWNTIAVVLVTGILGASFARSQGQLIWKQVNEKLARGEMPADSLFHGFLVFAGGLLLVTPGFVTDFLGLSMVMPGPRHFILRLLKKAIEKRIQTGQIRFYQSNIHAQNIRPGQPDEGPRPVREVIDIEAEDKKES
ncbi:MAG: FxsA family protein [Bdellovibrionales bacterium]|nr:FxsA family protein [Bdellovibrionales bacterium]